MSFMDDNFTANEVLREVRQPRIVSARLVLRNGEHRDIAIRNLSPTGFGASAKGPAPVRGERVTVILPGDQMLVGTVRWFARHTFGVELDTLISLEALALALQYKAQVAQLNGEWQVQSRHRVSSASTIPADIRRV